MIDVAELTLQAERNNVPLGDVVWDMTADRLREVGLPEEALDRAITVNFELPITNKTPTPDAPRLTISNLVGGGSKVELSQGSTVPLRLDYEALSEPASSKYDKALETIADSIDAARKVNISFKL